MILLDEADFFSGIALGYTVHELELISYSDIFHLEKYLEKIDFLPVGF